MDLQRLPLPVGSLHAVRAPAPPARPDRSHARAATALVGLLAAAGGAALGASPAPVGVSMDSSGYRVGDAWLPAQGGGVYAGPPGAVVIAPAAGGMRAAGSTRLHGMPMRGVCELARNLRSERCAFDLGGRALTATDVLRGGGWDRHYQDGQLVRIDLQGGRPVPVPIAIGR